MCIRAAGLVEQSRNLQSKPREKAGGRQAADLILQLPARGPGSAAILCTECQANEERAAVNLTVSID
jgi:hypothetical protein